MMERKTRKKEGDHPRTQPPVWWLHPPWIRPWAPSFFTSTLFTDANLISLSHPHCIIFLFFSFLFLLLEHLKGLNFLCQLGRAGYDSISNREKDLVLADIICELGCMKLVDNHLPRICQNQLHKNMGAFNQVISKLIQYIIDMNCFQRVRNVILPC